MIQLATRICAVAYGALLTLGLIFRSLVAVVVDETPDTGWMATLVHAGHFVAMMLLGVLVTLSRPPLSRTGLATLLLSYALMMEFLHILLPTRSFEWLDLLQNVSGVLIGMTIAELFTSATSRRRVTSTPDNAMSLFARVHDTDDSR